MLRVFALALLGLMLGATRTGASAASLEAPLAEVTGTATLVPTATPSRTPTAISTLTSTSTVTPTTSLTSTGTSTATITLTPTSIGTPTVTASATATATPIATATPSPTNAALPDLIVSLNGATSTGSYGSQSLIVYALTVQNIGAATSGGTTMNMPIPAGTYLQSVTLPCTSDGTLVSCPVSALAPQQPVAFTVSVYGMAGSTVITASATADPNNLVLESSESNNVASTTVYLATPVFPTPLPTPYYSSTSSYSAPLTGQSSSPAAQTYATTYSTPPDTQSTYTGPAQSPAASSPPGDGGSPNSFAAPSIPTPLAPSPSTEPTPLPPANPSSFTGSVPTEPPPLASTQPFVPTPSGYPWLRVLSPTATFSESMEPLWVAAPGELYYVVRTEDNWALGVRDGSSAYWSVWIQLDAGVQPLVLDQAPALVVDERWVVVNGTTPMYNADGELLGTAEAGESYRVSSEDGDWLVVVRDSDSPANAVRLPRSDAVSLVVLQAPGPGSAG